MENKGGLRLFGVRIFEEEEGEEEVMRKCASMGNLAVSCEDALAAAAHAETAVGGYSSDGGLLKANRKRRRGDPALERKKGVPWTEEEHRTFLAGLEKLGKGDWRGISRNFVTTRTPTQVASHAQKYFLRQSNPSKKKRRSSLFDVQMDDKTASFEGSPTFAKKPSEVVGKEIFHISAYNDLISMSVNEKEVPIPTLSLAPPVMDSDLELSIALPSSSQNISKFSSHSTIGAIRVV